MFELSSHGPDTYVGTGPRYPWGGLYGGQVVAQALRAARATVDPAFVAHSIRAYFIRRGDHTEPVRYEVDRIRNGRSFVTRRVVARQAVGAILNAECSFQRPEPATERQTVTMPDVAGPEDLEESSWSSSYARRFVAVPHESAMAGRAPVGRVAAWMRVDEPVTAFDDAETDAVHQCWLAFLSDDLPTDSVLAAHPEVGGGAGPGADSGSEPEGWFGTSLDHTIWFHRPVRTDRWHLHDVTCHHLVGARGLALGHVFAAEGTHVATVAQEVLVRPHR